MFGYFKAYALNKGEKGEKGERGERGAKGERVERALDAAGSMTTDYCFPSRLEELAVLQWAAETKSSANTCYYLGEVLWNFDRKDEAIAAWRKAEKLDPGHALTLRCLGFALTHPGTYFDSTGIPAGVANAEGAAFYRRALAADPGNPRILLEADLAARRTGVSAADRLKTFNERRATAEKYDPCVVRIVELCIETGDYDEAVRLLQGRHFHIWEGGVSLHDVFLDALVLRGDRKLAAKDFAGARADYETALTYPFNLEAAKPNHAGHEPRVYWALARCAKASGDDAACRKALESATKGEVRSAEMHYYRALALNALGRKDEAGKSAQAIEKEIAELGKPQPRVISAYAKFGGEQSPDERAVARKERARKLQTCLDEIRK